MYSYNISCIYWSFHCVSLSIFLFSRRLSCDGCRVKATGSLPPALSSIDTMTALDLRNNDFNGNLPVEWAGAGQFESLQNLFLFNNSLSGSIPWNNVKAFPSLQLIRLDNNKFTGPWPSNLTLRSLTVLRGFSNAFTGELSPTLLDNMPAIQIISLQNNNITGRLPREWANSTKTKTSLQEL